MNAPRELPAIALQRDDRRTLAEQLAAQIAARIRNGALAPGTRLPSVRGCARLHAVSPSTVVAAYDQLQALGLAQARQQRGFYVRDATGTAASVAAAESATAVAAPLDAAALIRGMFRGGAPRRGPGSGTLPESWLDQALLDRALRRVIGRGTEGLHYGDPAGDAGLREALARRLNDDLSIAASPEQIATTLGATHALDLVARTLLQPGDAVLVDEPGWAVEFARLSRMGMRLLAVPRGSDGPDIEVMQRLAAAHRPRLYVTVSVLHNPTGHSLSLASAYRLLRLAETHDLTIVEDDTYAWLAPPHCPRLAALDGLRRTVYVSGFSKILAPDWRVGFVAAAPALLSRLVDTKLLSTLSTPSLHERALSGCLQRGLLRRHSERIVQRLDGARQRAVRLAEGADCRFAAPPQGLFGWVDVGTDTDAMSRTMAEAGWLLAPGSLFHAEPKPTPLMRINFTGAQDPAFWRAIAAARAGRPVAAPSG